MICPKCGAKLVCCEKTFRCENNHTYDRARQGYVNLMLGGNHGDSKEMVAARHRFLNADYYHLLKERLEEIVTRLQVRVLLDLGCGEGYYTSGMSRHVAECYGVDLSKDALKIASRMDKHTQYVVASIFRLPFEDESVDGITNIFAPAPVDECARVLKNRGIYIRVAPHRRHLYGLKKKLYDQVYENEMELIKDERFELIGRVKVEDVIHIEDHDDIEALFMMTPYYWKSSKEAAHKVAEMEHLDTEIEFDIQIYRKKEETVTKKNIYLKHGSFTIRSAFQDDASQLVEWWNDGRVMAHAGFPKGLHIDEAKVKQQLCSDTNHKRLIIEKDSRAIGEMGLHYVDDKTAEIGIKICDLKMQDQRYGKQVLSLLIQYLFEEEKMVKIILDTDLENERAQHVYEQLGFKKVRVNIDSWVNQLGEKRSSVDYEMKREHFKSYL